MIFDSLITTKDNQKLPNVYVQATELPYWKCKLGMGHMYLTPFLKRQREMNCHKFKTGMSYTEGVLCWVSGYLFFTGSSFSI